MEKLNKYPIINNGIVKQILMGYPGWKERYYKEIFNIEHQHDIEKICINYFEGLHWNMKYYFENCKSWSWYYKHSNCPSLQHLYENFDLNTNHLLSYDNQKYKPYEQLLIVLPPQSSELLPINLRYIMTSFESSIIDYYPINYKIETLNKMFYWQCHPILPNIDDEKIKNIIENTIFGKEETERNKTSYYYEF